MALVALLVLAGLSTARGVEPKLTPLTEAEKAKNVEAFEVVWTTIRDKHFDPKLGGLDWKAVHDELLPKVQKAETMGQARAAMSDALDRLHLTHFGIIAAEAIHDLDFPRDEGGPGWSGIELRIIDGKAVVTSVGVESSAAKAGVKPGWVIDKIRDKPVVDVLAAVEKAYAKSGTLAASKTRTVESRLRGPVGSEVSVDLLDGGDKPVHLNLKLGSPKGTPARFGNLPTFYVHCETKRVDKTIGYIALNAFFDPVNVIKTFSQAIKDYQHDDGLILDLRGNPGGIGAMSMGLGGWFITESNQKLGTMITRDGSLYFSLTPRPGPFTGPLAVIVDELSMSTSEILAGGLKDLKRATIFGTKTPGAALPSRIDILPNGDLFQYAFANYIAVGGKPLEGLGVVPDIEAPPTRAALLEGRDAALEAAIKWVRSQKLKP